MTLPLIVHLTEADGTTTQVDNHVNGVPENVLTFNLAHTLPETTVTELLELAAHLSDIIADDTEARALAEANQVPPAEEKPKPARKRAAKKPAPAAS